LHQVSAAATTYDSGKQSRERDVSDPTSQKAVGLLMTRPLSSAQRFVADLPEQARSSVDVIYAPLMEIRSVPGEVDAADVKALIFSSANGVDAAIGRVTLHLPAYCVGERTTQKALEAGWEARCMGKTADDLVEALKNMSPPVPILHLHGRNTRGEVAERLSAAGLPCRGQTIYDQRLLPLGKAATRAISSHHAMIVPVFSPRTAQHFADICPDASNLHLIALSHAVAKPLKALNCRDLQVCSKPDAIAMAAMVRDAAAWLARVEDWPRGQ
jgi:uroporphyrinogen-III synthase